jgi:hypothetical protein
MEQKESLEKAGNDLRGIIVRTHRHCQTYRVRLRMRGGQCFDRSFRSKTLAKKWKRDMESAIEHDRYEFTNPATKHTLADLINLYIERVLPGKPRNAKNVLRHLANMFLSKAQQKGVRAISIKCVKKLGPLKILRKN